MVNRANVSDLSSLISIIAGKDGVLVGGMAVEFWRSYFKIETNIPNLTRDIDFFASRTFVLASAERIRAHGDKVKDFLATMDDAGPNSGKLAVYRDGIEPIEIDFLYRIDNISNDDIEDMAVIANVNGKPIRVVNPLILMEMKISNLAFYPKKRNAAGKEQARIAVKAAGMYLEHSSLKQRRRLNSVERIIRFSGRDAACYTRASFRIDPMHAITDRLMELCGDQFKNTRLPRSRQWLADRQTRFDRMLDRLKKTGAKPGEMRFS